MKIAVVGAGSVGGGLGTAWAARGHEVTFGVPGGSIERTRKRLESTASGAKVASPEAAADHADVVVLAVPWPVAQTAIADMGDLSGKVLIDVTNPLLPDFSWLDEDPRSGAERVAEWAKDALVYKAFNQTGAENLGDPSGYSRKPVMFAAGDDGEGASTVLRLIDDAGFEGVYAGPLKVARLLESYGMLWIHLAIRQGLGRRFAFTLERKAEPTG